jgi:polyether ionophore transport system permease protein
MSKHSHVGRALRRFGFKQSLKGALIIGTLAAIMVGAQGAAYAVTYPDEKSRVQFKSSLEKAPSLGVIYGEIRNLPSPAGYMVYRTVTFITFVASIWGLMTIVRLLRGQEEDGRWELIAAGNTTSKKASLHVLFGFGLALLLAFGMCVIGTSAFGAMPSVNAAPTAGLFIALTIFVPVAFFSCIGFLISQLSSTRRRALAYGLIPLVLFFAIRTIGNTVADLHWIKAFTPFGWTELASPVVDPQMSWLLPAILLMPLLIAIGAYFIGKRDLGGGIIHESTTAKPRYLLLGSALGLAIRQNGIVLLSWGIAALFMSAVMAQIAGIAAEAIADSDSLKSAVAQVGNSSDIAIAFIGAGLVFTVMLLLVMVAVSLSSIRGTEAKNQLENILVHPVRRSSWLAGRLVVIVVASLLISLACACTTWALAATQGIPLDLANLLLVSITLTGTVVLTLGFGTLLYGILPRIAVVGTYVLISWSFLIEMIGAVVKLDDIFIKSSLFHYISISPTQAPDWSTFLWLVALGVGMMILGIAAFAKRDIISE